MTRALALLLLVGLTACTAQPAPPTATSSSSAPTTTTTTTKRTDEPVRIDTPRSAVDVESCSLLTAEDFTAIGPFSRPPARYYDPPLSCLYAIGDGKPTDLAVVVGFQDKYRTMKAVHPNAVETVVGKHSALLECDPGALTTVICREYVAISDDLTLSVAESQDGGSLDRVAVDVAARAEVVLGRLPVAG